MKKARTNNAAEPISIYAPPELASAFSGMCFVRIKNNRTLRVVKHGWIHASAVVSCYGQSSLIAGVDWKQPLGALSPTLSHNINKTSLIQVYIPRQITLWIDDYDRATAFEIDEKDVQNYRFTPRQVIAWIGPVTSARAWFSRFISQSLFYTPSSSRARKRKFSQI
jgi:hypothetical protein